MIRRPLSEHIAEVMQWMDFGKIYTTMDALSWRWPLKSASTPDVYMLKDEVRHLMYEAYELALKHRDDVCMATGGFEVKYFYDSDNMSVKFIAVDWET